MAAERASRGGRLRLALWAHQLIEYLLGALIVMQSINAGSAAPYIAAAGGLLFLLAACTDGPFGVIRFVPARLHRAVDAVVILALVLALIVSGTTELLAWALCLLAAAALVWLNWHTQWASTERRRPRHAPPHADDTPAVPPGQPKPRPAVSPASVTEAARALGATVDRTTRGASRAAGRIYGRSRSRRAGNGEKPASDA